MQYQTHVLGGNCEGKLDFFVCVCPYVYFCQVLRIGCIFNKDLNLQYQNYKYRYLNEIQNLNL